MDDLQLDSEAMHRLIMAVPHIQSQQLPASGVSIATTDPATSRPSILTSPNTSNNSNTPKLSPITPVQQDPVQTPVNTKDSEEIQKINSPFQGSGSDSSRVEDRKDDENINNNSMDSDGSGKQQDLYRPSLQSVISQLVSAQTAALLKEKIENSAILKVNVPQVSLPQDKIGNEGIKVPVVQASIYPADMPIVVPPIIKPPSVSVSPTLSEGKETIQKSSPPAPMLASPRTVHSPASVDTMLAATVKAGATVAPKSKKSGRGQTKGGDWPAAGPRMPVSPTIPATMATAPGFNNGTPKVSYDKFGAIYYDYTLPDRGLSVKPAVVTGAFPSIPGAVPVGFLSPNWPISQTPTQPAVPSPATSDSGSGSLPLDLSATQKEQAPVVKMSPKELEKTVIVKEPMDVQSEEQTTQAQLYKKNMLIFSDKEVEIISVGQNTWVVRNETELCTLAAGGVDKKEDKNCCCQKCVDNKPQSGENAPSKNNMKTEAESVLSKSPKMPPNKRPAENSSGFETNKLSRLVNGDSVTLTSGDGPSKNVEPESKAKNETDVKTPTSESSLSVTGVPTEPATTVSGDGVVSLEKNHCPVLQEMLETT